MSYRGLRVAWTVVALAAVLVGFLVVKAADEVDPLGMPAGIWITQAEPGATPAGLMGAVAAFSATHGVDVVRVDVDLHDPTAARVVHVSPGAPDSVGAHWLSDGYPGFSRDVGTTVRPWGEQGDLDPRAGYLVGEGPEAAAELLDALAPVGFSGRTVPAATFREMADFGLFDNSSMMLLLAVTTLAVTVLVAASVLANAKTYGVRRLHGRSFGSQLASDARTAARGVLVSWAVVGAGSLIALRLYNGWSGLGIWAAWVGIVLLVGTGVLVVTHVLALGWTYQTPVTGALKGDFETGAATVSAYLARGVAVLVTLLVATHSATSLTELGAMVRAQDRFDDVGDASFLVFNGSVYGQDADDLEPRIGAWLKEADAQGQIVLAGVESTQLAPDLLPDVPATPVLVVNSAFLERSEVRLASGERLAVPAASTEVTVAVPQTLREHAQDVADVWVAGLAEVAGHPVAHRTVTTAPGQHVFTFGAGARVGAATEVLDPVIVVAPVGADAITATNYMAFASSYGVIVPSREFVRSATDADPVLERYVIGIQPVATQAAQQLRQTAADVRLQVTNGVVGLAVLLVTAAAAGMVHARRSAQATMARFVHGWSFVAIHRRLFVAEAALVVGAGSWIAWRLWPSDGPGDLPPGVPPPIAPPGSAAGDIAQHATTVPFALVLLLCGLVVAVVTVQRLDRRLLKEMSAGA